MWFGKDDSPCLRHAGGFTEKADEKEPMRVAVYLPKNPTSVPEAFFALDNSKLDFAAYCDGKLVFERMWKRFYLKDADE